MTPRDPDFAARIHASFARQGMMTTLGARISDLAPGHVELCAPLTPALGQQQGFAHGGLAFTLGDSAAGYAALSLMGPDREVLTVEMKINFLAPGAGQAILARGRVLRAGRTVSVVAADVLALDANGQEKLIAVLQGTMMATGT